MNKSESIKEITQAIIKVMMEVKGIEKNMTVGTGGASYKGVSDQDVKKAIGDAMSKNGLCLVPISVNAKTTIERWEEVYNNQAKQKQSVHVETETKYLLMHDSGEYIELAGYGHGVDSQDKAAGKATTYALKYALLYTFLVPTGKIDDADNTHSDDIPAPKAPAKPAQAPQPDISQELKQVAGCQDLKNLEVVWQLNPELHNNPQFKTAVSNRKKELTP